MLTIAGANFYTEREMAELLGKSVAALRKDAVRRLGPPRTKYGRRVPYREQAFLDYLLEQEYAPEAARQGV